ncbi:SDR family NAD(P)-dependent oxidoreductase [Roseateles sp. BYS180W]|uniref:SDR family NAD(P)-dependent oxidoreductase n=1 Tax=Roseateles rivi TaxID=3299028 RepID=A0ABW7FYP7_9BURK
MQVQQQVGRHAIVTGGGSGIGAAIAAQLQAQGWQLTLMGRRLTALQQCQARLGGEAAGVWVQACDVSDEHQVQDAFARVLAQRGLQALVNNAGMVHSAPLARTTLAQWQQQLQVNLTGSFLCIQAATAALRDSASAGQAARIVNVASTAALKGYAYVAAYCAAKHGVLGLTRALALEFAQQGITVNAVCPGYTDTELLDGAVQQIAAKTGSSQEAARQRLAQANPQQRLITPEEVAHTVAWLLSPGAASINGQAIAVCGGEWM